MTLHRHFTYYDLLASLILEIVNVSNALLIWYTLQLLLNACYMVKLLNAIGKKCFKSVLIDYLLGHEEELHSRLRKAFLHRSIQLLAHAIEPGTWVGPGPNYARPKWVRNSLYQNVSHISGSNQSHCYLWSCSKHGRKIHLSSGPLWTGSCFFRQMVYTS